MSTVTNDRLEGGTWKAVTRRLRRVAWLFILIADAGLLAWGAGAALAPERLLGPGATPILTAGYERFTGASWSGLAAASPKATAFITLLFRMYGIYIVVFGALAVAVAATAFRRSERWAWWALCLGNTIAFSSAMAYDWTVRAIGPFELTEYLGLAMIYGALALTLPSSTASRSAGSVVEGQPA
jgi:hypothetical protein